MMMMHKTLAVLLGVALTVAMAACSAAVGGGTDAPAADTAPTPEPGAEPEREPVPETQPTPEPEPEIQPEPEPVEVKLYVEGLENEPEAEPQRLDRLASSDAGDGGLHPSVASVQEGESFRLMVRFSGTTPIDGTCTITLVDSGGHPMADVTATANGFDASTDLIATVDDDAVTTDRTITATLASCDLEVAYTIGTPNTASVAVRDHDPVQGTQTTAGSTPVGIAPPSTGPSAPAWTKGSHTATAGGLAAEWKATQGEWTTVGVALTVNFSPPLPSLAQFAGDSGGPNRHTGQYTVEVNFTLAMPDGTKQYPVRRQAFGGGSSMTVSFARALPAGTQVRASLDAFGELFFRGGNNQYTRVSHYGYYSIGSPSSASATVPEPPPPE